MRSLPGKAMKRVLPVINKTANHLEKENKQLKAQLEKLYKALSFYKSAIKCGERWTEECENMWKEVEK